MNCHQGSVKKGDWFYKKEPLIIERGGCVLERSFLSCATGKGGEGSAECRLVEDKLGKIDPGKEVTAHRNQGFSEQI